MYQTNQALTRQVDTITLNMKFLVFAVALVAFATGEPPLSKSYLPPSPTRSAGYPQGPQGASFNAGLPEVVAARSLDRHGQEHHGNGFARNSPLEHGHKARFGNNGEHGYDKHNGGAFGRSAFEDAEEPANYNFGYMVNDDHEGTNFGHHEERLEQSAHGQYHVVLPDGRRQTVSYEADGRGFKPRVSYEDAEDLARNGYDSNTSNLRSIGHHNNGFDSNHGHHGARSNGY